MDGTCDGDVDVESDSISSISPNYHFPRPMAILKDS